MRRHLRAAVRLIALCSLTWGTYLAVLGAKGICFFSAPVGAFLQAWSVRLWARSVAALLAMRIEVSGAPPLGPCLLVANHLSYIDILLLATQTNTLLVAKSEVARWPVIGFLCRSLHTVFIDRERKRDLPRVIGMITDALRRGHRVCLFPEGTSTLGATVLPFKSSLFEAAVRAGVPVSYASLTYRTPDGEPPAYRAVCWWGDMTFAPHVYALLQLPGFQATVTFGNDFIAADNRKRLAARAWTAVTQQFTPLCSHENSLRVHLLVTIPSQGFRYNSACSCELPEATLCQVPSLGWHSASGNLGGTPHEGADHQ